MSAAAAAAAGPPVGRRCRVLICPGGAAPAGVGVDRSQLAPRLLVGGTRRDGRHRSDSV